MTTETDELGMVMIETEDATPAPHWIDSVAKAIWDDDVNDPLDDDLRWSVQSKGIRDKYRARARAAIRAYRRLHHA